MEANPKPESGSEEICRKQMEKAAEELRASGRAVGIVVTYWSKRPEDNPFSELPYYTTTPEELGLHVFPASVIRQRGDSEVVEQHVLLSAKPELSIEDIQSVIPDDDG